MFLHMGVKRRNVVVVKNMLLNRQKNQKIMTTKPSNHNSDALEDTPSKSQRKRDMIALQKIGETLVNLASADLKKIPLDDSLAKEINAARQMKSHEAKRRQLQYIGRLMRVTDPQPIQAALDQIQLKGRQSKTQLHKIERWRDQLIAGDDAVLHDF